MLGQQRQIGKQRCVALAEVRNIGAPVVLLDVDVQVVVARPRHVASQVVVPDALQVGGQGRIFARRADLHVASILEEQRVEDRVRLSLSGRLEECLGAAGGLFAVGIQTERHAVEQMLVVLDVRLFQLLVGHGGRCRHGLSALLAVVHVLEVGADVGRQGERGGIGDHQLVINHPDLAPFHLSADQAAEAHAALAVLVEAGIAIDVEPALLLRSA